MTDQEKIQIMNDYKSHCNGTDQYHQYNQFFASALITDGVKLMAETYGAFWLIDLILSYQTKERKLKYPVAEYPIQYWILKKNKKGGCTVTMEYIEDVPNITQHIEMTTFLEDEFILKYDAYGGVISLICED